jgi:hypothetical protein
MADIYIVNVATGGFYAELHSHYHHTEEDARKSYEECLSSVNEDHTVIELVRLNTETLMGVTLDFWEGNVNDLESEQCDHPWHEEGGGHNCPDCGSDGTEDDWIVEGRPEGGE